MTTLLLSDTNKLLASIAHDFPEVVKIESIGQSYQNRPIQMAVLDARSFLVSKEFKSAHKSKETASELKKHYHEKPAVLITG